MKTQFIFLALLLSSAASFAQSLEKSFDAMIAAYKQNPYAYVQEHFAPEARFIAGHDGSFMDIKKLITPAMKIEDIQTTDLQFFESGDLGVVSGVETVRYANPKGAAVTYKDAFTHTYKRINGDWKAVAVHHTKIDYK
jgi:ketosteroid isomerase-like protein